LLRTPRDVASAARQLDQPLLDRPRDGGCPVGDAELIEDVGKVRLDGRHADTERVCDLLVGRALGSERHDLELASRPAESSAGRPFLRFTLWVLPRTVDKAHIVGPERRTGKHPDVPAAPKASGRFALERERAGR
jgi:hypothetical protein